MPFDAEAARAAKDEARPLSFGDGVMSGVSLLARWQLGAIFLWAAWAKLKWAGDRIEAGPQTFALAIKAFKLDPKLLPDWLVKFSTFAVPWTEAICGVLLIIGLFTRAATLVTGLMLVLFIGLIADAMRRGLNLAHCGCFGEQGLICKSGDLPCHIVENCFMLAACVVILLTRRQVLAADGLLPRR